MYKCRSCILSALILVSFLVSGSSSNPERTFGIDVSHYQGHIDWPEVSKSTWNVKYVFIRATMGATGNDRNFKRNWKEAGSQGFIRGAYHYYRPNTNSAKQFNHFKRHVSLGTGDLPPVLDIEQIGRYGADNTIRGVKNWLRLAEAHYGVKPIIYTGRKFYNEHLKGEVSGYPLWIASYSKNPQLGGIKWNFHQFSDELKVRGIKGPVDGNRFKGSPTGLLGLCIK